MIQQDYSEKSLDLIALFIVALGGGGLFMLLGSNGDVSQADYDKLKAQLEQQVEVSHQTAEEKEALLLAMSEEGGAIRAALVAVETAQAQTAKVKLAKAHASQEARRTQESLIEKNQILQQSFDAYKAQTESDYLAALDKIELLNTTLEKSQKNQASLTASLEAQVRHLKDTVRQQQTQLNQAARIQQQTTEQLIGQGLAYQSTKEDFQRYRKKHIESALNAHGKLRFLIGSNRLFTSAKSAIAQVAHLLEEHQVRHIVVRGHTDNRGSIETNQTLSQLRAEAVKDALYAHGLSLVIEAEGVGSMEPIANNSTIEGRSQNRRIDFVVIE